MSCGSGRASTDTVCRSDGSSGVGGGEVPRERIETGGLLDEGSEDEEPPLSNGSINGHGAGLQLPPGKL